MNSLFDITGTPLYSEVIYKSRYARYLPELGRREEWDETVDRYISFMKNHVIDKFGDKDIPWADLREAILRFEVMPSMRAMMTAGPALAHSHVAGYNCAYLPVIDLDCFAEAMYILMCGTGVGFSVERQFVNHLPEVPELQRVKDTIVFEDSKEGWATGYRQFLSEAMLSGRLFEWDLSLVRPAGTPLKTFGGRASGPAPLESLLKFTSNILTGAQGRKLTSVECHDIMCKIAEVVVVGGVRRSALISLSNLTDERMRHAKDGQWWLNNPQRALSNNSVCYTEKPDIGVFMREWLSLYESKSGERGIFSREAAKNVVMANGRRDPNHEFGTNPCSEIILRPFQFCNLTEVVVRPDDTQQDIIRKAKIASILGTIQSTLTDFRFLRPEWTKNCVEERLLGVSMTGICDNDETAIYADYWVNVAKDEVIATNKFYAALLGINQSAATTCVKPSGTVSQLVNSSSGIHPRYAEYYIRRVRMDIKDPICKFLNDNNVPSEVDQYNPSALVFSFPIRSPNTITRDSYSALQQLYLWEEYQNEWCEHKPSITVYVRDNEWLEVAAWVYEHMDILSGVSFLPYDNGTYVQAPYEEITKEQYEALAANMPTVLDWSKMTEEMDVTTGSQELACVGGACEL